MNADGLRFHRPESSLHIRLQKPEKCGGGTFVFRQRQAGTRLPFLWRRRRIITVINKKQESSRWKTIKFRPAKSAYCPKPC